MSTTPRQRIQTPAPQHMRPRASDDQAEIAEAEEGLKADAAVAAPAPNIGQQSPNEKPTGPICPHCLESPCTKTKAG